MRKLNCSNLCIILRLISKPIRLDRIYNMIQKLPKKTIHSCSLLVLFEIAHSFRLLPLISAAWIYIFSPYFLWSAFDATSSMPNQKRDKVEVENTNSRWGALALFFQLQSFQFACSCFAKCVKLIYTFRSLYKMKNVLRCGADCSQARMNRFFRSTQFTFHLATPMKCARTSFDNNNFLRPVTATTAH